MSSLEDLLLSLLYSLISLWPRLVSYFIFVGNLLQEGSLKIHKTAAQLKYFCCQMSVMSWNMVEDFIVFDPFVGSLNMNSATSDFLTQFSLFFGEMRLTRQEWWDV